MLKEFMVHRLLPQQERGGHVHGLDPLRAAVVVLCVCHRYSIRLTDAEGFRLCAALCLPQRKKEDFTNYWANFSQDVPFLRRYVLFFYSPPQIPKYNIRDLSIESCCVSLLLKELTLLQFARKIGLTDKCCEKNWKPQLDSGPAFEAHPQRNHQAL